MRGMLIAALATVAATAGSALATPVQWIDWQSSSSLNGFTAHGQIVSGSEIIDVTYNNPLGVSFIQTGTGINYFNYNGNSPYQSAGPNGVENDPTPAEMIALRFAGPQTLTFSQTVANLYLSFVSLNGNGWGFDQDFELLSFTGGDVDGQGADGAGYWGSGGVTRVDNGDGTYALNNLTSGEPHGTILFLDTFDQLTWTSLNNENWNGFTLGVQGTAEQVGGAVVPLPAALPMLLTGVAGIGFMKRRRKA